MSMSGFAPSGGPILLAVDEPRPQRRLTVLVRLLMAIPHAVLLSLVGIAAAVVVVIGWFGALATGSLPAYIQEFLTGYIGWQARVGAYLLLLTDRYPRIGFEAGAYPIQIFVPPPSRLNRLAVLFRLVLLVPVEVIAGVMGIGAALVGVVAWCIVLVTARLPLSLQQAFSAALRLRVRVSGYGMLLTSVYPWWGLFGDPAGSPPIPAGAGRLTAWPPPPKPGAPTDLAGVGPDVVVGAGQPQEQAPSPDVFTYGGPTYLWGYSADRQICGIWHRAEPGRPGRLWPISEQETAWATFRSEEPGATLYDGPAPVELGFSGSQADRVEPPPVAPAPVAPAPVAPAAPWRTFRWSEAPESEANRWAVALSQPARRLVVLMLVVGIAGLGAEETVFGLRISSITTMAASTAAASDLAQAYDTLHGQLADYERQTTDCASAAQPVACVDGAAGLAASGFGRFAAAVGALPVRAGAKADQRQLAGVSSRLQQTFDQLAGSSSAATYEQTLAGSDLQALLRQFDTDYQRLEARLLQ